MESRADRVKVRIEREREKEKREEPERENREDRKRRCAGRLRQNWATEHNPRRTQEEKKIRAV